MTAVPPIEGLITVDSNGTQTNGTGGCSGGSTTVDVSQGQLHALPTSVPTGSDQELGEIRLVRHVEVGDRLRDPGLRPGRRPGGRLAPTPIHVPRRATRAPVDHRWNCKTGYPAYDVGTTGLPRHRDPRLPGRGRAAALHRPADARWWAPSGAPPGSAPIPRAGVPSDNCNVAGAVVLPAGNWFVNCANLQVSGGTSITFSGGNVVTRGRHHLDRRRHDHA